jgi:sorbitol-specific phosphotransferase system component IIBC
MSVQGFTDSLISAGFGVSMISYNGTMRLGIGIDQAIIPSQAKVQELLNFVKEELYIMGQDSMV